MGKQIILGISFANLCYLRVWSELLSYTPAQTYEMRLPPGPHDYGAVLLNVLLLGTVCGVVAGKLPQADPKIRSAAQWLWLIAMLVPLNALRTVLASRLPVGQQYLKGGLYTAMGPGGVVMLGVVAAAGGAFALHHFRERICGALGAALLIAAPLAPMTMAQAAWMAVRYDPRPFADRPSAPRLAVVQGANPDGKHGANQGANDNTKHGVYDRANQGANHRANDRSTQNAIPSGKQRLRPRIVWVIFDEWDQRVTFDDRPPGLGLPAIDRFRGESLAAENAYPPRDNTLESIPSLFTGRLVERAEPAGPGDLRLSFRGGAGAASWQGVPNVFDAARSLGSDTALVGVYHPYCRVLAASLSSCWWMEMPRPINSNGRTLPAAMRGQARSLFETWRLSAFGQSLSTKRKARELGGAVERAKAVAADLSYRFVVIHLLTPHFPHAYDRATGAFTLGNAPLRGYYDSLALTDTVWAELRRSMEAAGVWDPAAVLLSSDHGMKHSELLDGKKDSRVPFLLKLPRQTAGRRYAPAFNTVVTADLLLAILEGQITTAAEAARWLDGERERGGD
jgi:hypothetical protein